MSYETTLKLSVRDWFHSASQAVTVEPRTPQARFPLHEHEFGEIVIVMSGNGWHVLNDEPQFITCGEIFYIRPEDRHAFEEVNELCLTNVIYRPSDRLLRPERLQLLLEPDAGGARRRWQVSENALGLLRVMLDRLAAETSSRDPLSELMAESLFIELSVALCRHRFVVDDEDFPAAGRLGHAIGYLRRHCTDPIDLEEVARRSGYSFRNFNRVFRDATATTPHNYLAQLRLGHALRALRTTDDRITDIALACGFSDSNYFSSCFSKRTGVSPREFRRRVREAPSAPPFLPERSR
jgi:AraC-like DNA-binding protein